MTAPFALIAWNEEQHSNYEIETEAGSLSSFFGAYENTVLRGMYSQKVFRPNKGIRVSTLTNQAGKITPLGVASLPLDLWEELEKDGALNLADVRQQVENQLGSPVALWNAVRGLVGA